MLPPLHAILGLISFACSLTPRVAAQSGRRFVLHYGIDSLAATCIMTSGYLII
jgi:hypothetical protein